MHDMNDGRSLMNWTNETVLFECSALQNGRGGMALVRPRLAETWATPSSDERGQRLTKGGVSEPRP